ncbi:MAG: PDZ domain-containing protein [Candidatus Latescibacteria bacterium]|nr:PDZ domain-containing protein [Candidatus Latescibacterota bacterium]
MRFHRLRPFIAALMVAGVGLAWTTSGSWAQGEDGKKKVERKVEKKIQRAMEDADRDSDAGYLGVQVQSLNSSLRRAKSIPGSVEGALVSTVEDGSPADDAGIRKGDVILEVDRKPTTDPSDLIDVVRALEPESKVSVSLWREGSRKTVTVTVGSRPDEFEFSVPPSTYRMRTPRGGPDRAMRMEMFRRGHDDIAQQLRDIQEQLSRLRDDDLARLERQIRDLRADLRGRRAGGADRDRDDD